LRYKTSFLAKIEAKTKPKMNVTARLGFKEKSPVN